MKFAPDSSYWKHYGSWITSSGGPGPVVTYHKTYPNWYVHGDTVVVNKYCQKIWYTNKSAFDTICKGSLNLLYYYNKQLFLNNDRIYNFNITTGDTTNIYIGITPNHAAGYYTYTVSVHDSVNMGGKWRKRLKLMKPPVSGLLNNLVWVDGIGDINYGFNAPYSTIEVIQSFGSYGLNCFSEKFLSVYGTGCGIYPFCGYNDPVSSISCSSNSNMLSISLSGGVSPYTFTVQTPVNCSIPSFTSVATTTNATFTLNCNGTYTFSITDANNTSLGSTTHSVSVVTYTTISVSSDKDSICNGDPVILSIIDTSPTFTVNPINWSNGSNGSPVTLYPNTTTTYSLGGVYTSVSGRTCTATGTKSIVVNSCVGINEYNKTEHFLIFPIPASNKIVFELTEDLEYKVSVISIEGKEIVLRKINKREFDVSNLAEGLYFLKLETEKGILTKKIIIQH